MIIKCLFIRRKDTKGEPELLVAWDEFLVVQSPLPQGKGFVPKQKNV